MSIRLRRYILSLCLILPASVFSQTDYQMGLLPVLNFNKKLKEGFRLNVKAENRQIWYEESSFGWSHELLDLSSVISKKIGLRSSIAGGYLLRLREGKIIHRSIQQFTIIRRYSNFRLSHRIAADQSFDHSKPHIFRLRYRLSTLWPLKGQRLNPNEFYLKLNNEYLNSLQAGEYNLELRLVAVLGYEITDNNKLEMGLDQRFANLIHQELKLRSWGNISWFISL